MAGPAVDSLIGRLGDGQLFAATAIAAFVDELLCRVEIVVRRSPGIVHRPARHQAEQPRAVKVNVGEMKPHRSTLGDLISFVEVFSRTVEVPGHGAKEGAGKEGERDVGLLARAAQEVGGFWQMLTGAPFAAQKRLVQRGAGEGEVV